MAERSAPAQAFLGMAARTYDAARAAADDRALELRLATLFFARAAFEARINDVHEQRVGSRSAVRPDPRWRWRDAEERLETLLGHRAMSRRRRRLLRDVAEMWEDVTRPAPIRFVQQMGLDADTADAGAPARLLLETPPQYRVERYRPAALPADPLALEERPLQTCLLVMLEHLVLLERRFRPDPPLRVPRRGRLRPVEAWFDEMRDGYDGPHAAYFKRIRLAGDAAD